MFVSSTLEASFSLERITQKIYIHQIQGHISLRSRCSRYLKKLTLEQSDEILECLKPAGQILHGNSYLWSNDEEVIGFSHAKVYVFSDSVLRIGKVNQNPASNTVPEQSE